MDLDAKLEHAAQHLILKGTVRRKEEPVRILGDRIQQEKLKERLSVLGLELIESHATDSYGIRAKPTYWTHEFQDLTNNKGLGKDAFAVLCIFWAKLVLPYRVQIDRQEVQGQVSFDANKNRRAILDNPPVVQLESVFAEFKEQLPAKTSFMALVGRLKGLGFLRGLSNGCVTLGPNLDTALEWRIMKEFIEGRLAEVAQRAQAIPEIDNSITDEVYELLTVATEPLGIVEIESNLRLEREVAKEAIDQLRAEGLAEMIGDKKGAKYRAIPRDETEEE